MTLALKQQAEATNVPRIGFDGNYAFPTMQLNISSTKSAYALERERVFYCLVHTPDDFE